MAGLCVLLAGCAGSLPPERRREANARMEMGISYLRQTNLPAAMRELTLASELDPQNPEIDMGLGLVYQARTEWREAERHFRNALRKKPDYADARNNLGVVLSHLGRGDEALKEFEAAARNVFYATPEMAYFNMGEEYRRQGKLDKAEEAYRKSVAVNGQYTDASIMLALVQGSGNRWDEAARTLEASAGRNPTAAGVWMELGRVYRRLGRKAESRDAFANAMANTSDPALRRQASELINLLDTEKR